MMTRLRFAFLLALACLLPRAVPAQPPPERPYVVLVSLDAFRYDYAERYRATNILAIAKSGAAARALIPIFPSFTFPNHISIVTGLYPEHHGIVENGFYDPARKQFYEMGDMRDGSWYRAKPIWVLAEEQKVKTACQFWPTSDAEILGVRPTYWKPYDMKFPNEQRVAQVLDWLKLPADQRPHFIATYFSDVDAAGHKFGPDAPETAEAVQRVDKQIGDLWNGIRGLNLPVNLILVSDHGMQKLDGFINLAEFADFSGVKVDDSGVFTLVYAPDSEAAEKLYRALKGKSPKFEVYRRSETPASWHFSADPRIGDLIVIAKGPNMIGTEPPKDGKLPMLAEHGFDPGDFSTMNEIFYAAGPNVKPGVEIPPFENVNIFPFVTRILGLQNPPGLDGSERVLAEVFRP
jgi:predicted AlkP superfamily pyrophosphatase or phosphodiesterase